MKQSPRTNQQPVVSIIIPVFNKCDLTMQCLEALARSTSKVPHEIIVVDNGSTDDTPRRMQGQAEHIRYIRNEVNLNFAAGCNQGAAAAKGKYYLFLNNDTIPLEGWLEALLDDIRTHPEVAAVGAKLLYESGLVQHAGVAFGRETRNPFHPYRLLRADDPRVNHRRELQAVTAACVLFRPKWFNECGRFHEGYRNGYEDLDLCLSIRKRGGVIVYQPRSVVFHLESQSPGRMKHDNENRSLFFRRWNNAVLSDEDLVYFEDGHRIVERRDGRPEAPLLARFDSEEERQMWSIVAQTQRAAANWNPIEVAELLAKTAVWPQNPNVRGWAAALCRKLQLAAPAEQHLAASLPETTPFASALAAWKEGDFEAARTEFENALLKSGSPAVILPHLWELALQAGWTDEAERLKSALLALPRVNPQLESRLRQFTPAARMFNSAAAPGVPSSPRVGAAELTTELTSIIILVLNQLEHTRKCLESIAANTPEPHEVIVVDNGSTDGTPAFLKEWQTTHPNCAVIRNETNRGFAGGNNLGLTIARGSNVILLNNDTVVTAGWVSGMLDVPKRHPETGVVGPVSNNVSGPQFISSATYKELSELPAFAGKWNAEHRGESVETGRVVGFCLLAKRAVIEKVGGLDECFGSGNFEDDDFCIRARIAGFRIRIARDVFIHHTGSQTFKGAKIDYRQAMLRNWDIFKTKWNLPAEASLERGYPIPRTLPGSTPLTIPLPDLGRTHEGAERLWTEKGKTESVPALKTTATAPVAKLGNLESARTALGQRELSVAWSSAVAAIDVRPFHPESYLLLAEIALAAGDANSARVCAQHARDLAPGWKAPKQFLQKPLKGNARPEWLVLPEPISNLKSQISNRLTVCVITKNEEKFIAQCLKSVQGLANQIVVVDTGSTDRTVEIAKTFGAEIHTFTWCDDFAAARNAALEHASGDWVLMLDADEELPADQHANLNKDLSKAEALAYRLPLVNVGQNDGRSFVPRLFRNVPGAHFHGRIHEQVFPSLIPHCRPWGMKTDLGTAQLLHHGYTKEMVKDRNKIERNLRLLKQAIEERPNDVNLVMNLGLELVRSGDLKAGLERYETAFQLMSAQPPADVVPELREVLLTQYSVHLYRNRQHIDVIRVLNSPLAQKGGMTASLHFALGLADFEMKNHRAAAEQMRQCVATRNQPALSPINTDILTCAPNHCLGLSLMQMGDPAGAEKAFLAALTETGNVENVKLDYARLLVQQNRHVDALHKLHEIVAGNPQNAAAWKLGAETGLSRPEFLEFACDWTAEAIAALPEDKTILAQRAEALLLSQQTKDAHPLWERACNCARPPQALAALILCSAVEAQPIPPTRDPAEETATSRAFVGWYQRLVNAGAEQTILRLNSRVADLRQSLPTAANLLNSAIAAAKS